MDISGFKNIIQKISFVKEYSFLLLPVVIIVVAGLLFIPTQLINNNISKQVASESISVGKRVGGLIANSVSSDQWKEEEEYQRAYAEDANQISLLAKQSSERELLSYKVFPEPKDTSSLIFEEFGQRFRSGVDKTIAHINGHDCPSQAELVRSMPSTQVFGKTSSTISSTAVDETVKEAVCRTRAESSSVYVNPSNLSGYEFWGKYKYVGADEAVKDCWYWQLGYWIIEDVIDTIASENAGSKSVFTSPVKRLLNVSFAAGGGSKGRNPRYVLAATDRLTESCTGRLSSSDIDVVHFSVSVVISTKEVLPFMQQLCSAKQHKFRKFSDKEPEQTFKHNQITILESSVGAIDRKNQFHNLYRYGEDTVVRLDLICEYILNRKGYDEIKPKAIKDLLPSGTSAGNP